MRTSVELKNDLLESLAQVVDHPLRQAGFIRKTGSFIYFRTLNDAEQWITFVMDSHPKCQPGAEAHIHPMLQLAIPKVCETALALVKGDKFLLANAPDIIVNQPIDCTAPKDRQVRWFATGHGQFVSTCEAIKTFIFEWVLPFLSEVTTPADLVKIYENRDMRMMQQQHWHIRIAAAYKAMGQIGKAREVVQQHFGSPGLRKRYAPLFVSLDIK